MGSEGGDKAIFGGELRKGEKGLIHPPAAVTKKLLTITVGGNQILRENRICLYSISNYFEYRF